ncbi:glutathione S-transferase, amine-terminal domain protein (macronuclear) [Tetrahymena thermophila SB210]|uniref:glutathione transferase n=1 Tax=Tetrahymena thermophila (strain SB210) TaxID=312017 RepID=I7MA39_TETTS|nr:glutathione S-transferase, amine-terminal domain protein [Tetrahymena thermophila SB210]EAS03661.1 glutathione S-transferase, amine-terminal domain protein [Tetrahymena thermophila SB210]|eukprot:XP_001023906.1 glutathione S-transferase, amine-terminal domain protein [Tetrahymena thermophila SB210]
MQQQQQSKIKLGYWDVRGRGEPIRLLLNYLKLEYEDEIYPLSDREKWFNFKRNSQELFINLPYVQIESKETQSQSIYVESDSISIFICQNFGGEQLLGKDLVLLSKMRGVTEDVKLYLSRYAYHNDFAEADQLFLQKRLQPILLRLNTYLQNYKYLLGSNISYLDFVLYESLKTLEKIKKEYLQSHTYLVQYIKNIENIPQIKAYLSSERFHKDFLFYGDPSPI